MKVTEPSPLGFQLRIKRMELLMKSRLGSTFLKVKCLINADTACSEFLICFYTQQGPAKFSSAHGMEEPFSKGLPGFLWYHLLWMWA